MEQKDQKVGKDEDASEPVIGARDLAAPKPSTPLAALTADMIFTQPVVYEFPLISVPTLLVIGQRDRTALGRAWAPKDAAAKLGDYPALGRKAAAAIPGAKLVEIPGVGHLPQVEAFDAYSRALAEFLP